MQDILFTLGNRDITVAQGLIALGAALALLFVLFLIGAWRGRSRRLAAELEAARRSRDLEGQVTALLQAQSEMTGRMQTMSEIFGSRQSELNKTLSERLDGIGHRLNQSVGSATKQTQDHLKQLHERLAVIDAAQKNIHDLAGQVTTLSNILGNKQARGAFGQGRMETIIADGLPTGSYSFQPTLSNSSRPDCTINMPNDAPPLVIDAKFPLEAFNALKQAENPDGRKAALQRFRNDVIKHVKDIKERYLIPGETQDTAFMFVPSESVFAEINEQFEDVVARAHKARIVIVSPSLMMLSIQVIQAILRDARLREQAHVIQTEVINLLDDMTRLGERVDKLKAQFSRAQATVNEITVSSEKVARRGQRIEGLSFGEEGAGDAPSEPATPRLVVSD
jgi:DNA recombination protein RmuC